MAFDSFAKNLWFKTIDTDEIVKLGRLKTENDSQVRYMRLIFSLIAVSITTERFRINVVPEYGHATKLYQSDWMNLSKVGNPVNWLGWIRFDFADVFFDSDVDYFLELEHENYNRNLDVSYIGISLDVPFPINENVVVKNNLSIGVELYEFG